MKRLVIDKDFEDDFDMCEWIEVELLVRLSEGDTSGPGWEITEEI